MLRQAEAVVVGGGVIGGAIAFYLSVEGVDVALIEAGDFAGGTSGACDGNVLAVDKRPGHEAEMILESQALFEELDRGLGFDFEYRQHGSVLAVEGPGDMAVAGRWTAGLQEAGIPAEVMDSDQIHADAPGLADDIAGGVVCHSDSSLCPMRLTYGLVEGARARGTHIYGNTRLESIDLGESGQVVAVRTGRGMVPTNTVVISAGIWSPAIGAGIGIDIPIKPRKGHILVAERCQPVYWRKMMEFGYLMTKFGGGNRDVDPAMDEYGVAMVFEPTPPGNFLIGSSRQFAGHNLSVDTGVARLMARRAMRFFPAIAGIQVIRCYTGLRPCTPDHTPIVSAVESVPGLYIAAGHEGDGIGLAPVTGRIVSAMVTGQPPPVDPHPLSLSRFAPASD